MVKVSPVTAKDVNPAERYVAHAEAIQAVDLRARIEGVIEQINFREGSDVRAGDLLFIIEKAPYQARVENDKAVVAQNEANLSKARQFLQRAQTVSSGAISASDLENAQADEQRATAQLEAARANLKLSQINLDYTTIRAPIGGRIGRSIFSKGSLVNPASGALARIVQLDPIRVTYAVSENDIAEIAVALKESRKGPAAPFLAPRLELAGNVMDGVGRIDFVDNVVDPSTGTVTVRALFDNRNGILLPGQYLTVLISRSQARVLPVVPQAAVLEDQQGRYVLIVDDENKVEQRRVKTGPTVGTVWAIESGVKVDERVITQGLQKVRPGQMVKVATE
jgi:membrane fusion protein (multidrug efflux system)